MKRRRFLKMAALVGGGYAVLGRAAFAVTRKIRIGVLAPSHCALPAVYAQTRGLFKKSGVDAEIVYAKQIPEIVKGLQTGDLDFGQVMGPSALAMAVGVPDLPKMNVAATQFLGTNGGVLSISAKSEIKKLADLKGKTIGIHGTYMVHYLILVYLLQKVGINPKKDVTIKIIPMSEMAKALEEGQVDGIINPEPVPSMLEKKGVVKNLIETKMFWPGHPCCFLATKNSLFEKERLLASDVTRACMVAGLTLENEATRIDAIKEVHGSSAPYGSVPLPVLLQAFTEHSNFYPFPYRSAGVAMARRMKSDGLLPEKKDAEALVKDIIKSEFAMGIMAEAVREVPGSKRPSGINRREGISQT